MKPSQFSGNGLNRRLLLSALAMLPTLIGPLRPTSAQAQSDPLASWNDGATKQSITDFGRRFGS